MSGEDQVLDLQSLGKPILGSISSHLENIEDVLSLSSSSVLLRDSCSDSSAWRTLCDMRWGAPALHTHLFSSSPQGRCDYKALFLGVNGWRRPLSQEVHWTSVRSSFSTVAISCSPALSPSGNLQACSITSGHVISMAELASPSKNSTTTTSTTPTSNIVSWYQSKPMPFHMTSAKPCSIQCLDYEKAIVAIGDIRGSLHIVHLPSPISTIPPQSSCSTKSTIHDDEDSDSESDEEIEVDAFVAPHDQQYPITCFEYHRQSTRLFCLWDRGECGAWRPNENGVVRIFDVEKQQLVSSLKEILDYYELCTILCPDSPSSASNLANNDAYFDQIEGGGGNELISGTVKISQDRWADGTCPRCNTHLPVSLCWHQHRSSNAALAFFDLRAGESPGRMVHRHPLPHRSLYPRLQLVRDHYVMISHAGAPLVIWDRRCLDGGPVATPQLVLDTYALGRKKNNIDGAEVALPPERLSNALYLSCCGSMLAGRADNGEIGVYDLSNILGWWNKNKDGDDKDSDLGKSDGNNSDLTTIITRDVSEGISRLQLEEQVDTNSSNVTTSSNNESSTWKRPVLSAYVPMVASTSRTPTTEEGGNENGMVVRPRAEVWIGPDWLAATGQGQLHYFFL